MDLNATAARAARHRRGQAAPVGCRAAFNPVA
jgi:hypothetical protein